MSNVHGLYSNRGRNSGEDSDDEKDESNNRYVGGIGDRGGGRFVRGVAFSCAARIVFFFFFPFAPIRFQNVERLACARRSALSARSPLFCPFGAVLRARPSHFFVCLSRRLLLFCGIAIHSNNTNNQ